MNISFNYVAFSMKIVQVYRPAEGEKSGFFSTRDRCCNGKGLQLKKIEAR